MDTVKSTILDFLFTLQSKLPIEEISLALPWEVSVKLQQELAKEASGNTSPVIDWHTPLGIEVHLSVEGSKKIKHQEVLAKLYNILKETY